MRLVLGRILGKEILKFTAFFPILKVFKRLVRRDNLMVEIFYRHLSPKQRLGTYGTSFGKERLCNAVVQKFLTISPF